MAVRVFMHDNSYRNSKYVGSLTDWLSIDMISQTRQFPIAHQYLVLDAGSQNFSHRIRWR